MNSDEVIPLDSVSENEDEKTFFIDLENRLKREIDAPSVATHQEVISHLKAKYAFK
jgi:hypothetical protein